LKCGRGAKPRIIFAGAGHANISALRRLTRHRLEAELILVNHGRRAWYTGALPALIRGDISPDKAYVDAAALAVSCGASFIDAKFSGHDNEFLYLDQDDPLPFNLLSLSPGAAPNGGVKPIETFHDRLADWATIANIRLGINGTGPAGIELALAMRIRLGPQARIHIAAPDGILKTAPRAVRQAAQNHLDAANIQIAPELPPQLDETLNAYTPEPTIKIRATLQLEAHDNIFATGDHARFPTPLPRSGAIAVRQGRFLAANLTRALAGQPLAKFTPPKSTLAILSLNAHAATAWYGNLHWTGYSMKLVKKHLDRAWINEKERRQSPAPPLA
jgi:selenide,water dikinase